jgi:hypothetical protein
MRPKKGDWVVLHIRDHCQNSKRPPEYFVCGRVHSAESDHYVLDWWSHPDPTAHRDLSDEVESITILREAVKAVVILHRGCPFEDSGLS